MIELTDIDATLEILQLRERHFASPTALMKQHVPLMLPNTNVIPYSMYTQSVSALKSIMVNMALSCAFAHNRAWREDIIPHSYTQLSAWLFDFFQGEPVKCEYKIQVGTSPEQRPTEAASIVLEITSP